MQSFDEYPERDTLIRNAQTLFKRALRHQKKQWGDIVDFDQAMSVIKYIADHGQFAGIRAVVLNGTHLLFYSVGNLWFIKTPVLVEQFFIRIAPGPEAGAYAELDELARELGLSHIIMATAFAGSDEALGSVYERHGYTKQSSQYIKEVTWPQSPASSPA